MYMSTTFLPVLAAGVANVILGFIWYHPRVFGGTWMRFLNFSPEMTERGKKNMPARVLVAFFASIVTASVMQVVGNVFGVYGWTNAMILGAMCWLGFTAPTMLGMVLWELKPFRYYLIVAGYWLVAFEVTALILLF